MGHISVGQSSVASMTSVDLITTITLILCFRPRLRADSTFPRATDDHKIIFGVAIFMVLR